MSAQNIKLSEPVRMRDGMWRILVTGVYLDAPLEIEVCHARREMAIRNAGLIVGVLTKGDK